MAGVAQSVEQLICNQPVAGSSPIASSREVLGFQLSRPNPRLETAAESGSLLGGEVPEWPKGTDCKSVGYRLRRFESSPLHH